MDVASKWPNVHVFLFFPWVCWICNHFQTRGTQEGHQLQSCCVTRLLCEPRPKEASVRLRTKSFARRQCKSLWRTSNLRVYSWSEAWSHRVGMVIGNECNRLRSEALEHRVYFNRCAFISPSFIRMSSEEECWNGRRSRKRVALARLRMRPNPFEGWRENRTFLGSTGGLTLNLSKSDAEQFCEIL